MGNSPTGLVAGAGIRKDEVRYRQHEKCLSCIHFYGPNSCDTVAGNISPEAVCDRWEVREADQGKDGEFYKNAYESGKWTKNPGYESGAKFYQDQYEKGQK
jgi:hypothetical protein